MLRAGGGVVEEDAAVQVYARAEDGAQYLVVFCPYRGLQPFEAQHRRFLLRPRAAGGRAAGTSRGAWRGELPRFQLVAGTSGSGKSSLVRAGLLPGLRSARWQVAVLRPGGDGEVREKGLVRLARALRDMRGAAAAPGLGADEASVFAEARCVRERHPGAPIVLVVDQMEESFRLEGRSQGNPGVPCGGWRRTKG